MLGQEGWLNPPCFWAHLFIHLFWPRLLKVRSPGHIKWPHLRKVWMLVLALATKWSPQNFQRLIQVTISTIYTHISIECISQNCDIGDLRSCHFCDLSIFSQWVKNERCLIDPELENCYQWPLLMSLRPEVTSGHARSPAVFGQCLVYRHAREIQTP